jgi:hypothetical protein
MAGMGCGPFARQARHFLKNNYIYPVTQSDPPSPQKHPKIQTPKNPVKKVFPKMPCLPCDMTPDHEG